MTVDEIIYYVQSKYPEATVDRQEKFSVRFYFSGVTSRKDLSISLKDTFLEIDKKVANMKKKYSCFWSETSTKETKNIYD